MTGRRATIERLCDFDLRLSQATLRLLSDYQTTLSDYQPPAQLLGGRCCFVGRLEVSNYEMLTETVHFSEYRHYTETMHFSIIKQRRAVRRCCCCVKKYSKWFMMVNNR